MPEVQARYGILTVPDVTTDVIGKFLQHYGEWAWDEARFVASVLPEHASVLDVGAFLGTFGLGVAANANLRQVCFVEANAAVAEALQRNVQRNAQVATTVCEALVKGTYDAPHVGHADTGNLGSTSFVQSAAGDSEVALPTVQLTLAELRSKHGPFDLIKLDVEGMEADILKADADFLASGETMLWVECNENAHSIEIAELLLSWGLDVYYFAFPSHNPDSFRGAENAIFPMAYEAGLLAGAKTAPVLDEMLRAHGCILQSVWSSKNLREIMWLTPRWGMAEWHGQSVERVAALAGHALRGDNFANYLQPGWASKEMIWERVDRLQTVVEAERSWFQEEQQALTERERLRRSDTEQALAETASLALDRLAVMGQLRDQLAAIHDAVQHIETARQDDATRHAHVLNQADAIWRAEAADAAEKRALLETEVLRLQSKLNATLGSATWRMARPFHRAIDAAPGLHAVLARSRRLMGRILRGVAGAKKRISGP